MFLEIPTEILSNILDFLTFQDRLNLVRTCRHLKVLISERHLYEELPTFKSECKLQDALDLFRNHPIYGSQVKRLHIKIIPISSDVSMQLPFVFPNIKELRTDGLHIRLKEEIKILLKWKDTLDSFHGENGFCVYGLFICNTFSYLSSLNISLPKSFFSLRPHIRSRTGPNDINTGIHSLALLTKNQMRSTAKNGDTSPTDPNVQFFNCFENTPSLRHLELLGGYLYLQYLEKLHAFCPQLTSLSLSTEIYVGEIDALSSFIEPATQLRYLKIDRNSRINDVKNIILDYLTANYTNLTKLIFLPRDLDIRTFDFRTPDPQPEESIRKRREFISSLPSTIKTLKLNTFEFKDTIGALQESALDLKELVLYTLNMIDELVPASVIMNTSHFNYIQNLKSLESLTIGWNSIMENNSYSNILDSISNLTVQIKIKTSNSYEDALATITSVFPSLKYLKVTSKIMYFRYIHLIPIKGILSKITHPNIRILSLDQLFLSVEPIELTLSSFPNMKELELNMLYHSISNDAYFDIDLEGCDLDTLSLVFNDELQSGSYILFYLQVKTLTGLKSYEVKLVPSHEISHLREVEEVDTSTKSIVRVMCDNIKMLKVNDMDTKPFF